MPWVVNSWNPVDSSVRYRVDGGCWWWAVEARQQCVVRYTWQLASKLFSLLHLTTSSTSWRQYTAATARNNTTTTTPSETPEPWLVTRDTWHVTCDAIPGWHLSGQQWCDAVDNKWPVNTVWDNNELGSCKLNKEISWHAGKNLNF